MTAHSIAITGGTTGIGKACVDYWLASGAQITLFDIAQPQPHPQVHYIPLDLGSTQSITSAIAQAQSHQPFTALCNVAGIPPRDDNTLLCLKINTLGTIAFTQAMLPMMAQGSAIISVASKAGARWQQHLPQIDDLLAQELDTIEQSSLAAIDAVRAYELSKEAVILWSKQMAVSQLGKHRFVTISPSAVDTAILGNFVNAFGDKVKKNAALVGRTATAKEIGYAVFTASHPDNGWLNGIDICLDGGMGAAHELAE